MSRNIQIFTDIGLTERERDIFTDQDSHVIASPLAVGNKWSRVRDITPGLSQETIVYLENFEGVDQNQWPSPWTTAQLSGTGSDAYTQTNRGILQVNSASRIRATLEGIVLSDFIYRDTYNTSDLPLPLQTHLQFRGQGEWESPDWTSTWRKRGYFVWADATDVYFAKMSPTLQTEVISSTPFTFQAGVDIEREVIASGNEFELRLWQVGQSRPAVATLSGSDPENDYPSGVFDYLVASTGSALDGENLSVGLVQISVPEQQVEILNITPQDSQVSIERSSVLVRDSYVVRYRESGGVFGDPIDVGLTNPFVVGTLTNGQQYGFQVAEVNAGVIGNWSTEVLATPASGTITSLSFDQASPTVGIDGARRLSVSYVIASGDPSRDTNFSILSGGSGVTLNKVSDTEVDVITDNTVTNAQEIQVQAVSVFDNTKTDTVTVTVSDFVVQNSAAGDFEALMELYNELGGNNWHNNANWGTGTVVTNDWHGVIVDENNRVLFLDLAGGDGIAIATPRTAAGSIGGNNLSGARLTPKLCWLTRCKFINVMHNNINAELPHEWGNGFTDLEELYLSGPIGIMHRQRFSPGSFSVKDHNVDEATNTLYGTLPPSWSNWPNIKVIKIDWTGNKGSSPSQASGGVSGTLPPEWGTGPMAQSIRVIHLPRNPDLTGSLPPEWGNMVELNNFSIEGWQWISTHMGISGTLPPEWGGANGYPGMRKLYRIYLSANDITGGFPASWGNMQMLHSMFCASTNFDGQIADFLNAGQYTGRTVVSGVTRDTNTKLLAWDQNQPDPDAVEVEAYHVWLTAVQVDFTSFNGPVPDWNNINRLSRFNANGCGFTGDIGDVHVLTRIIQLDLAGSSLTGGVGSWGAWSRLRFANLSGANLSGPLPAIHTGVSNFRFLNFAHCGFTGGIPSHWGDITSGSFQNYKLNNNDLGPSAIPTSLANLVINNIVDLNGSAPTYGWPVIDLRGNNFTTNNLSALKTELENLGLSQTQIDRFIQI